jgi:MFS transporter, DHA2 family, multidrug resistance protein
MSTHAPITDSPAKGGLVLTTLILVAAVANLNLSVANVALPSIGAAFDSSQTALNFIAIGYSLGLAASVLYLGALGDRYGRKVMLILGVTLAIPASVLAAYAPTDTVLAAARVLGGVSAGMAYPTTLALITALWIGPGRTKAIALWSGVGGAISALGSLFAGIALAHWWWGSVFLLTLPLAILALVMAVLVVPSHVKEATEKVDNLGGVLSIILVAALVIAINFATVPNEGTFAIGLAVVAIAATIGFVIRQRRAANPLYDLTIASRRVFWVAACAGIIVFGSLMGAIFIGQQFMQNVLGYSTVQAGAAILPAVATMIIAAPLSAKLIENHGSRVTLLVGYISVLLGFICMWAFWTATSPYWIVGVAFAFVGFGVGLAGTPASHALTGSVPVRRAGMASGTADLQRDLGGAIMQSIMGALLTAGYTAAIAASIASAPAADQSQLTDGVQSELEKSFSSAAATAAHYPQYATGIIAAAKQSFLDGADKAYAAGILAIALGTILVFFAFPHRDEENALLEQYADKDAIEVETVG